MQPRKPLARVLRSLCPIIAPALAVLAAGPADANIFTWRGFASDTWDVGFNWFPNGIPDSNDIVSFDGATPSPVVYLNGNRTVRAVAFGGTPEYELRPDVNTDTLSLVDGDIFSMAGAGTYRILCDLVLLDTGEWEIGGLSSVEVSGVLSGDRITKTGTGTLLLTGGTEATPSSLGMLRPRDGDVVIDGAYLELTSTEYGVGVSALNARDAEVTIQNGATVVAPTNTTLVLRDACTLTVTGTGTSLTGHRMRVAELLGTAASVLIEDGGVLHLEDDPVVGWHGDGALTVQSGASVEAVGTIVLGLDDTGTGDLAITGTDSLVSCGRLRLGGR